MKSFRPKDEPGEPPTGGRNDSCDFHGERRANDSHASTTIPMPGSTARVRARRRSSASSDMY